MSYHNPPLYLLPVESTYQISTNIIDSYFRQHVTMVDLLLKETTKRNGSAPYSNPTYTDSSNYSINDTFNNNILTKEKKESDTKDETITQKSLHIPCMKNLQPINHEITTKYLHQHITMVDMLLY